MNQENEAKKLRIFTTVNDFQKLLGDINWL